MLIVILLICKIIFLFFELILPNNFIDMTVEISFCHQNLFFQETKFVLNIVISLFIIFSVKFLINPNF